MAWSDIAARAVDAAFTAFGEAVTVTSGGTTVAATAIVNLPSRDDPALGEAGWRGRAWSVELRLADMPAPAKGDNMIVRGTTCTITAAPEIDEAGLVARCPLRPVP